MNFLLIAETGFKPGAFMAAGAIAVIAGAIGMNIAAVAGGLVLCLIGYLLHRARG